MTYFGRFWVKDPRHSETISDEKCYIYRSTRRDTIEVVIVLPEYVSYWQDSSTEKLL